MSFVLLCFKMPLDCERMCESSKALWALELLADDEDTSASTRARVASVCRLDTLEEEEVEEREIGGRPLLPEILSLIMCLEEETRPPLQSPVATLLASSWPNKLRDILLLALFCDAESSFLAGR